MGIKQVKKKKIISREEAIQKGLSSYFTGKPCINGHIYKRATINGMCYQCNYERAKAKRIEIKAKRAELAVMGA